MRGACVALVTIVALTSCSRRDKAATDESQSPSVVAVESTLTPQSVAAPAQPDAFDWRHRVGVAGTNHNRLLLALDVDSLEVGTPVLLVTPDSIQASVLARVIGVSKEPLKFVDGTVEGRAFVLVPEAEVQLGLAIAIVGETGTPRIENDRVALDLNGDGEPETFNECTSHEGLHLTIRSGEPAHAVVWHRYVYAGIDLGQTCTEHDSLQ